MLMYVFTDHTEDFAGHDVAHILLSSQYYVQYIEPLLSPFLAQVLPEYN